MGNWSKGLQDITKKSLENYTFGFRDDRCYMKKWCEQGSLYGIIFVSDILASNWTIRNPHDESEILGVYPNIETLIKEGWVLD